MKKHGITRHLAKAKWSLPPKSSTDPTAWVSGSFKCEHSLSAAVNQQAHWNR